MALARGRTQKGINESRRREKGKRDGVRKRGREAGRPSDSTHHRGDPVCSKDRDIETTAPWPVRGCSNEGEGCFRRTVNSHRRHPDDVPASPVSTILCCIIESRAIDAFARLALIRFRLILNFAMYAIILKCVSILRKITSSDTIFPLSSQ